MAKLFSKREWLGAVLLVVGVVALAVFILQVVLVVKWVGWDYTGPMKIGALWDWVNSPANREKLEPLVSLITIIASLAIGAVSLLLGWLRKNADRAPDGTTAAKPTRWDSIRGDLIRTVRKH